MAEKYKIQQLESRIRELEKESEHLSWKEKAIREREETFRILIENSPEGIVILKDMIPAYMNDSFSALFGYTSQEILGMESILPVVSEEDRSRLTDKISVKNQYNNQPVTFTLQGIQKDGSVIALSVRLMSTIWENEPACQLNVWKANEEEDSFSSEEQKDDIPISTEHIPVGVCRINYRENGRIATINRAFLDTFGYETESEVKKLVSSELFATASDEKALTTRLFASGSVEDFVVRLKNKSGKLFWGSVSGKVILGKGGKEIEIIDYAFEDINRKQQMEDGLREREKLFRKLIEGSLHGILIHRNFKPFLVNQACGDLFGYTVQEILDMDSILSLISKHDQKRILRYNESRQRGENAPIQYEYQGVRKDGGLIWLENWVTEAPWEGETVTQEMIFDISYRKRAEKALKKAKADAENSANELIKANKQMEEAMDKANEMAALAEKANQAKSDLMARVSHELRIPINNIIGMSNLVLDTELSEDQLKYAKAIKESSDTLMSLINDILDYSHIMEGNISLEEIDFDVKNAVETIVESKRAEVENKKLEFVSIVHNDIPSPLVGDPWRIRQILTNLVDNAVKYTQRGEITIRVSLEKETETHATVQFSVIDTGMGISEEQQKNLFKSFTNEEDLQFSKEEEAKFNLAICKQLVEMMGGAIEVESQPGKGSTFRFELIFEKRPNIENSLPTLPADIRTKRILAVEADSANRDIMNSFLSPLQCSYSIVSSKKEAVSLLKTAVAGNNPFHLAFIGHLPPILDGEDLGRKIKSDGEIQSIEMVMLTSYGQRGDAQRVKEIGFSGYFVKPVDGLLISECLGALLGEKPFMTVDMDGSALFVTRYVLAEARKKGLLGTISPK